MKVPAFIKRIVLESYFTELAVQCRRYYGASDGQGRREYALTERLGSPEREAVYQVANDFNTYQRVTGLMDRLTAEWNNQYRVESAEIISAKEALQKHPDYFENVYQSMQRAAAYITSHELRPSCTSEVSFERLSSGICLAEEKREELLQRLCEELTSKGYLAAVKDVEVTQYTGPGMVITKTKLRGISITLPDVIE